MMGVRPNMPPQNMYAGQGFPGSFGGPGGGMPMGMMGGMNGPGYGGPGGPGGCDGTAKLTCHVWGGQACGWRRQ